MNAALDAPAATVVLVGTVAFALLLESATANPPVSAALLRVTVQADDPGAFTLAGAHVNPLTTGKAARFTVVVLLTPPKLAVTIADASTLTVPAVAPNVPVLDPALTVILVATVSTAELLDRETIVALVVALVSVTVQVAACADPNVLGAQLTDDNCGGATKFSDADFDTPLPLAVRTAV